MNERSGHYYEFEGFRYFPDKRLLIRLRDSHPFNLTPKENALLLALIDRRGEVITYDDLKAEVWSDNPNVQVHTIRETKHTLGKLLGQSSGRIETVSGQGYRFNVEVTVGSEGGAEENDVDSHYAGSTSPVTELQEFEANESRDQDGASTENLAISGTFAGYTLYVIGSCAVYAFLFVIALFVEVAYQYERFSAMASRLAPFIFLWIFGTSVAGLWVAWRQVRRERANGLYLSILIFTGAGLLLYAALGLFLPKTPITEASFQTYTAHGAYLKSVCYYLFLVVIFLIVPFHFVLSAHRELQADKSPLVLELLTRERLNLVPEGAIYFRVWWLGLILLAITLISPALTARLFDNLKPNPHMNLFMQLVEWRLLLYLALGLGCLLWYYRSLGKIKRECLRST